MPNYLGINFIYRSIIIILPPCPKGHGQGGFSVHKTIDGRFQSYAISYILANLSLGQHKFVIKIVSAFWDPIQ